MLLILENQKSVIRNYSQQYTTYNKVIFEAILHTSGEPNANGRIYDLEAMKEAVESLKPRLKDRTFGGELDHPLPTSDEEHSMLRHMTLSLADMSHIITDMWFEGNKLVGTCETTNTPKGQILYNLIVDGVNVGFSIRAISDNITKKDGYDYVKGPITLVAIDAVSSPSHKGAKVRDIIEIHNIAKLAESDAYASRVLQEHEIKRNRNTNLYYLRPLKVYEF